MWVPPLGMLGAGVGDRSLAALWLLLGTEWEILAWQDKGLGWWGLILGRGCPCPVLPAGTLRLVGWTGAGGLHLPGPRSIPAGRRSGCSRRMHAKIRHFFFLFCLRIPQKANIHER